MPGYKGSIRFIALSMVLWLLSSCATPTPSPQPEPTLPPVPTATLEPAKPEEPEFLSLF